MTGINFGELLQEHKGAGDPPPDGIYDCVCTKAEAKMASTGKPMILAAFKVLTGPEANKTITNNFVLSKDNPNAFWFFVRHMAVFGVDQATLAQITDLQQLAPMLVNKQARLTIQKDPQRTLPNVTRVEPVPGGMLSAAPQVQAPTPAPTLPAPALPEALYPQTQVPQNPAPPVVDHPTPAYQAPQPAPGYDQYGSVPQTPQVETAVPPAPQPPQAPAPQPPAPQVQQPPQDQGAPPPPQVPF